MKSPDTESRPIDRLYSLTLLLEEAIDQDNDDVLSSLLTERDRAIKTLNPGVFDVEDRRILDLIMKVGAQVQDKLEDRRQQALARIQDLANTKSGLRTYQNQKSA